MFNFTQEDYDNKFKGKHIVVSFSGGRTSAYMSQLLMNAPVYRDNPKTFIFANTGKENEETLEFVHECDRRWGLNVVWVEAVIHQEMGVGTTYKVVDYKTASRNGEPFEKMNKKYGIPNQNFPHCTRELKAVPIKKWLKDHVKDYWMVIGIRFDEIRRMSPRADQYRWFYPLITQTPTDKRIVKEFWDKQDFDLGIPDYMGNCDLCWKKSQNKKLRILQEFPEKGDWWADQEAKYDDGDYFTRGNIPFPKLMEIAKDKSRQYDIFEHKPCACFSNLIDGDESM